MTRKKHKGFASPTNYDLFEQAVSVCEVDSDQTKDEFLPPLDELYNRFRAFNVNYFAGKLPTPHIRYSNRLLAAGLYVRDRREIVISRKYHTLFPDEIDDTLKHEMIHIVHFNHDKNFKGEARRIGASFKAKSHPSLRLPPRYIYECPVCKTEYPRRKQMRMVSCGKCSPSCFDRRYKLVLKQNRIISHS